MQIIINSYTNERKQQNKQTSQDEYYITLYHFPILLYTPLEST